MAHLLVSLERAAAEVAVAIVPESWAFAERDEDARRVLGARFDIQVLRGLVNSTFKGARANAILIRLERRKVKRVVRHFERNGESLATGQGVEIVRGGLPVFESVNSRTGIPYIHSTDLVALKRTSDLANLKTVRSIGRGIVTGHVVLIPRVGIPHQDNFHSLYLGTACQLSDCVIALRTNSKDRSLALRNLIVRRFPSLVGLYRGTGARYTTVGRVASFVKDLKL
jgi:hypothetical protein